MGEVPLNTRLAQVGFGAHGNNDGRFQVRVSGLGADRHKGVFVERLGGLGGVQRAVLPQFSI